MAATASPALNYFSPELVTRPSLDTRHSINKPINKAESPFAGRSLSRRHSMDTRHALDRATTCLTNRARRMPWLSRRHSTSLCGACLVGNYRCLCLGADKATPHDRIFLIKDLAID